MKRQTTDYCGILALDKPMGITSHDVVDIVRRATGERRVGHAGTLDPMATGLMLVCVGAATRLSDYLMGHDKSYRARIVFGAATDTDDAEGRVVTAYSKKAPGEGLQQLSELVPEEVLASIIGDSLQLPPAYSAIKKNGVVAYKAAREGKEIELEARPITIHEAKLVCEGVTKVDLSDGADGRFKAELPYWDVDLRVSKGTYIRSIARDLGQRLGCGAHIGALRRTACAACTIEDTITLKELALILEEGNQPPWLDPTLVLGMPVLALSEDEAADIANGKAIAAPKAWCGSETGEVGEGCRVALTCAKKLAAIAETQVNSLKPVTVIPGGVCGVA